MKLIFTIFFILNSFFYAQETTTATANMADPLDINNSFITKFEYGKMLFNNPRGIGCNSCHGDNAKGQKIMDFKQEHDKKIYNCSLVAPNIKDIDYETFSTKVNSKKNPNLKFEKEQVCEKLIHYANVMPTYFLVEEEIEAIFYYIKNLK
ncbi:MAG: c-type cytochrome [Aliarcobacter sp.]|nr:c-type cytochrome [Aliarcobacter sp.]